VLNCNYQTLPSLSHQNGPLTSLRHSITSILTTNVQNNGSYVRIEEILNDMISLFPSGGSFVIEVIQYLIKPSLSRIVGELVLNIFGLLLKISELFAGADGHQ